jgi:glutaredoxin
MKEEEGVTLFTKEGCEKCEYVKSHVDLKGLGVSVEVLSPDNPESLAHLAWHELVTLAETQLPILVLDDNSTLTGAIRIKNYLSATPDRRSTVGSQNEAES